MMPNELIARFLRSLKRQPEGDYYLGNIDIIHQETHDQNTFVSSMVFSALANNGYARMRITAPATKDAHLNITVDAGGECLFKTYRNSTYTVAGTAMTPFNRVTASVLAPLSLVKHTPTINVAGTSRGGRLITGGTGGNSIGSNNSTRFETIVSAGDDLLIEVQNISGNAKNFGIVLDWYEEVKIL